MVLYCCSMGEREYCERGNNERQVVGDVELTEGIIVDVSIGQSGPKEDWLFTKRRF